MLGNGNSSSAHQAFAQPRSSPVPEDTLASQHDTPIDSVPRSIESIEAEALALLGQRKRRKRVRYSCVECHRRKHKCDRETPCGKCVERGVASACTPHDGSAHDVYDRVKQLQHVLSQLVKASRNALHRIDATVAAPASAGQSGAVSDGGSTPIFPDTDASSARAAANRRHCGSATPRRKSNPGITTAASLPFRAQVGAELLEFSSSTKGYPPSAHFERLVRQGSLQQDEIRHLASALPSQAQTAILLDVFFRDINSLMFPFDEIWFREAVNSASDVIWGDTDIAYGQDGPNHLSVIALLFAILALTYLAQPIHLGAEEEGAARAARMSFQCRKSHMLAGSIQSHDPFIILSYILLARFLILQRQAKDSWLVLGCAIREAQSLGLHRLGPAPSEEVGESREAEMRRTIWMHLYFEDRFSSLIVGQAPFIHEPYCDTRPPQRYPQETSDPMHFEFGVILNIRYELSRNVSKALDVFFSDECDMVYDEVLRLDRQLQAFRDNLPLPYRMDDAYTGFTLTPPALGKDAGSFRKIVLQRFVLHISIFYLVISIHIPFLRRRSADSDFERSRQLAMEAAIGDHHARTELRRLLSWPDDMARESFVGGRFFYFHATSTLGLCLLSEPHLNRVREHLALLDEFLEFAQEHQRQLGVDPDRCIRQEISIVSLIRSRVSRKFALDGPANMSRDTQARAAIPEQIETNTIAAIAPQPTRTLSAGHGILAPQSLWSQNVDPEILETRQSGVGQDTYDWWSWLMSSLDTSDPVPGLTPADTIPVTDANASKNMG